MALLLAENCSAGASSADRRLTRRSFSPAATSAVAPTVGEDLNNSRGARVCAEPLFCEVRCWSLELTVPLEADDRRVWAHTP
jgi:hypothetical protein